MARFSSEKVCAREQFGDVCNNTVLVLAKDDEALAVTKRNRGAVGETFGMLPTPANTIKGHMRSSRMTSTFQFHIFSSLHMLTA